MRPFLPKRFEHVAFGLLLSGMMSFIVSGVATAIAAGIDARFAANWFGAWLPSWAIAFPSVMLVAPVVRRILTRVVIQP